MNKNKVIIKTSASSHQVQQASIIKPNTSITSSASSSTQKTEILSKSKTIKKSESYSVYKTTSILSTSNKPELLSSLNTSERTTLPAKKTPLLPTGTTVKQSTSINRTLNSPGNYKIQTKVQDYKRTGTANSTTTFPVNKTPSSPNCSPVKQSSSFNRTLSSPTNYRQRNQVNGTSIQTKLQNSTTGVAKPIKQSVVIPCTIGAIAALSVPENSRSTFSQPKRTQLLNYKTTNAGNINRGSSYTKPSNSITATTTKRSVLGPAMIGATTLLGTHAKSSTAQAIGQRIPKQGYAIVLNHKHYKNKPESMREGTQFDEEKLKEVFDAYNIETVVQNDPELQQIKNLVNRLKYQDFSKYKCFIMVILTHGKKNDILLAHDEEYNFKNVIEDPLLLNKSLRDKLIIFLLQACRNGEKNEQGENSASCQSTVGRSNILKCYATYEGYVAFRNKKEGSIFIQTFCRELKEHGKLLTITDLMGRVTKNVNQHLNLPQSQVVTTKSSMTSSFRFGDLLK